VSRPRYEALGYSEEHIKRLIAFDEAIYARPVEEIREAVMEDRDASD
jgi:hypothetical protein